MTCNPFQERKREGGGGQRILLLETKRETEREKESFEIGYKINGAV